VHALAHAPPLPHPLRCLHITGPVLAGHSRRQSQPFVSKAVRDRPLMSLVGKVIVLLSL
jgi:hypothetical protein